MPPPLMPVTPNLRPGLRPHAPDLVPAEAPPEADDWANWAATLDTLAGRAAAIPWATRAPALSGRVTAFTRDSGVGPLRVLLARDRALFEELLRFLMRWPDTKPVPANLGAMLIQGIARKPVGPPPPSFLHAASRPKPALLDIALVSHGPYSDIPPPGGMSAAEWDARSLDLRLEHEACHFTASRLFDGLRFDLQDELVADFAAMMAVFGSFSREMFCTFMGITPDGSIRPGARVENYLPAAAPPAHAAAIVQPFAAAAATLETMTSGWSAGQWRDQRLELIRVLTAMPLDQWSVPRILTSIAATSDD